MNTDDLIHELRTNGFEGALEADSPLAPKTTWRIGGPAKLLASPSHLEDILSLESCLRDQTLKSRWLGNGSNLLIADEGLSDVVVELKRRDIKPEFENCECIVEAGVSFPKLANQAARAGLSGLEFGVGIPGTLGGALIMNAGWHEHEIKKVVEWVEVLNENGSLERWSNAQCGFKYRGSKLKEVGAKILRAKLNLIEDDPQQIQTRLDQYAESRKHNQPTSVPSCGSVFVQPPGDYAGRLIDEAGLKGLRVGDIEVSELHANFFINHGNGTAQQVLELASKVEQRVYEQFGVKLEREFIYWQDE